MTSELIIVLAISAFCIGISKSGFSGVSLISVFLLAESFGAKESLGVALPLLIMGDLTVYPAYRKHGSWRPVWKLLWPTFIGIAIAMWVLNELSNDMMRNVIGYIILMMVVVQLLRKAMPTRFSKLSESHAFGVSAGVSGGVATMLANAAGPILQMYLLSCNVKKMDLIGIGARFFLVVNFLKVPLNAELGFLTRDVFLWDLAMLPVVVIGVFTGKKFLKRIPQLAFEWMIVIFALIAGLRLVLVS